MRRFESSPSDEDSGTEARSRRDEIHELIEFGVKTEAIMSSRHLHANGENESYDEPEGDRTVEFDLFGEEGEV